MGHADTSGDIQEMQVKAPMDVKIIKWYKKYEVTIVSKQILTPAYKNVKRQQMSGSDVVASEVHIATLMNLVVKQTSIMRFSNLPSTFITKKTLLPTI